MVAALTPPVTGTTRVFAAIAEQLAMEVSVDDDIDDSQAKDEKLPASRRPPPSTSAADVLC